MASAAGRRLAVVILLLALVATVAIALWVPAGGGRRGPRFATGAGNIVGIIRIEGPITGGASTGGLLGSSTGSDHIIQLLNEAREDDRVRAVVLRLNTPGGSAAAAEEIGVEIRRLQEAGKPVVASMGDTAASGGYWIAALTDHIVASPATLTGSIGVIMELTNLEGLYERLGIEVETIKSGEHKDIGSPTRELTEEERALLQGLIDDIFDQFVTVVAEGRGLSRQEVLALADGRVFTGRQALAAGLVDSLGSLNDAVEIAAELAGIEGDYTIRELGTPATLGELLRRLGAGGLLPLGVPQELKWIRWELYPQAR